MIIINPIPIKTKCPENVIKNVQKLSGIYFACLEIVWKLSIFLTQIQYLELGFIQKLSSICPVFVQYKNSGQILDNKSGQIPDEFRTNSEHEKFGINSGQINQTNS